MYQTIIHKHYKDSAPCNLYSILKDEGSLFLFVENQFNSEGFIEDSIFDFLELYINAGFKYVNIIIYPIEVEGDLLPIKNNISYIIWLVKDTKSMFFNKDNIREKHIWKDVEWGKREKNYNSLGKDPSNVWIPTKDNGKGVITEHELMSTEQVVNRCIISTYIKGEKILLNFSNINIDKLEYKNEITVEKSSIKSQNYSSTNSRTIVGSYEESSMTNIYGNVFFESSEDMSNIQDESMDLMITSPPYWDLKNYFKQGQIGQETYEMYLVRMRKVWSETYKKLKNTGSAWININIRCKNKEPILIPQDIIKQCKEIGFHLKDIIIWHKSSGIPTHKNNIVDKYEFFLWFVKTKDYKINNYMFGDYKNDSLNNGLIWNINRKAGSVGKDFIHPAVYPKKLVDRIINLCSTQGDTILEPFLGSGTTLISSVNNGRNCYAFEYNEGFEELIKYRINREITDNPEISFNFQNNDFEKTKEIFRSSSKLKDGQTVTGVI